MQLEVRQRFQAIEAVLQSVAESQACADARMDRAEARMDRAEAYVDKMEACFNKRMEEIPLAHKSEVIAVRRRAVHGQIDRNLRSMTKKLAALIAYVNRPATAPR